MSNSLDGINEFPELMGAFIIDPEKLIQLNLRLRKNGLQKKSFPKHYYAIGQNNKTNYYLIDLRENPIRVYGVENNKSWSFEPEDMTNNILITPDPSLDSFLNSYVLFHFNMKRKQKTREEAGILDKKYSTEEIYNFLGKLRDK